MTKTPPSNPKIEQITRKLLEKADAYGVFPTPVDQIIEAAGLVEVETSLFDDSLLAKVPRFLRRKIDQLKYKVLAAIDRREKLIYIDIVNGNDGSIAFRRLHEVTHGVLPWQCELGYADDNQTLSFATRRMFEKEANFGASELLFQNDKLELVGADYHVSIATIIELASRFGSSIHAAYRRYAATHTAAMAAIVLELQDTVDVGGNFRRNEIISSANWDQRFECLQDLKKSLPISKLPFLREALLAQATPNTIVKGDFVLNDLNGEPQKMHVEAFNTTYKIFVLVWLPKRRRALRGKRVLVS